MPAASGPSPRWRRSLPALSSAAVFVFGAASLVSAVLPESRSQLESLTSIGPTPDPVTLDGLAAATGLVLLVVSLGLRRRKRRAWWMATILTSVGAAIRLEDAPSSIGALAQAMFGLALVTALVLSRRHFAADADPRSTKQAGATLGLSLMAATVTGLGWLWLRDDELVGHPSALTLLGHVLLGMVGVAGPVQFTSVVAGHHAALVLGSLGTGTAVAALSTLLQPHEPSEHLSRSDESRLRALIANTPGGDSLGYFALRRDKSVLFSPSGKAAVCYRVIGGVTLASGDPLGDSEAWSGAIHSWLSQARRCAWTPAVIGASKHGAEAYRRAGLDALEIGDEAITDVSSFRLHGRDMRGVRQAANRVRRRGGCVNVSRVHDLTEAEVAELVRAGAKWREGSTERGYCMALGRFADPADTDCLVVRAYDDQAQLRGFLHFVPWARNGLSLDLMRRDPGGTNGVVEAMVVAAMQYAAAERIAALSLNFATFRSVFARGDEIGASPVLRLTRWLLRLLSKRWQIESLYRANAKYQPRWEPRYLCFERFNQLPRVGLTVLRAESLLGWTIRQPRIRRPRSAAVPQGQ